MTIISPFCRASFPDLEEATQINGQGDAKFRLTIMIPNDDPGIAELKKAAAAAAKKKWPSDIPVPLRSPFLDGDTMPDRPEYAGHTIIRLTSKTRPQIVDARKQPILPSDIYSGCNIRVSMQPYAWSYLGKSGVSFGLGHVQKVDDNGEHLDGRGTAEQVFDVLAVSGDTATQQNDDLDDVPF